MPRPPFDPELSAALELGRASSPPLVPPASVTPEMLPAIRRARAALTPAVDEFAAEVAEYGRVSRRRVAGLRPGDPEVELTVVRPRDAAGPLPCVYHCHGGGMISGDSLTGLSAVLEWGRGVGPLVVVSVDYRLAPEHPHPAPVDDAYAGLRWTAEHASELGIDPELLVVAGMSAGGGIAAALALRARDELGPAVAGQLLMCPMLDDRGITPSSQELRGEGVWDAISNRTGWDALLAGAAGSAGVSAYAAPARAQDLSGLPPTFLDVGSAETFRDEVVDYAVRIWQAGGRCELHVWPGGWHGFDVFAPQARLAARARSARTEWLGNLLS
ncbi:alpha/beta hydrolase [Nocardioides sp. LHD-245]|uniref:alpha/beta hydrolase n=1 Tax=Nocardioides sp. LHD-245 TaxID=3051387 RepID=UPI0027E18952|nr:alpha/beta hydrolase [Nocardioides sp. LHD-245]